MYGTLGFIDNGRRAPQRESHFLGMSNNPSRKELSGARRPEQMVAAPSQMAPPTAPPGAQMLVERRCVYLEEQGRRREAEIAQLRAQLVDVKADLERGEAVHGTVLVDTREAAEPGGQTTTVRAGEVLHLVYPMRETSSVEDGATSRRVWMQRRVVDPVIASVAYTWVLLFEEVVAADSACPRDTVYVGNFE